MIWVRSIGLQVGGTAVALALVLAVFFLCAAAGNFFFAPAIQIIVRSIYLRESSLS